MSNKTEQDIHTLFTELLRDKLKEMKNGKLELNSSFLSTVQRFLKDNDIQSLPKDGTPLGNLIGDIKEYEEEFEALPFNQQN